MIPVLSPKLLAVLSGLSCKRHGYTVLSNTTTRLCGFDTLKLHQVQLGKTPDE